MDRRETKSKRQTDQNHNQNLSRGGNGLLQHVSHEVLDSVEGRQHQAFQCARPQLGDETPADIQTGSHHKQVHAVPNDDIAHVIIGSRKGNEGRFQVSFEQEIIHEIRREGSIYCRQEIADEEILWIGPHLNDKVSFHGCV